MEFMSKGGLDALWDANTELEEGGRGGEGGGGGLGVSDKGSGGSSQAQLQVVRCVQSLCNRPAALERVLEVSMCVSVCECSRWGLCV